MLIKILVLSFSFFIIPTLTKTKDEWKDRIIYQILTDRQTLFFIEKNLILFKVCPGKWK